jgi:hypothetical protein
MPHYTHHAACGLLWKRAIYIVGGEIGGVWSKKAYKFDFNGFEFVPLNNQSNPLKMASLEPIQAEALNGFFLAGQNEDGLG